MTPERISEEPARMHTLQIVIGDPQLYWTVRLLESLDLLVSQLQPAALLDKAFGAAEGGLIFRIGFEAIDHVERTMTMYRDDLSNPL